MFGALGATASAPDGLHGLFVEDRQPRAAGIDGLPHAAGGGAEVEDTRIAGDAGDGGEASAARGA
jgi:hypothetical protein